MPRRISAKATAVDPVTDYARGVTAGTIPAGPHVRNACARHLRDLDAGQWTWDLTAAMRAINFFPDVLIVNNTAKQSPDEPDTLPFVLLQWQQFVVGSLFGWVGDDGYRRYHVAYIEAGKASGKTGLASGIGLLMLFGDGKARAEVYAAAASRDQARTLMRDAVAMVKASPEISSRATFSGGEGMEWNIAYHDKASFMTLIASDSPQSGRRVHCALLDEIHEHHNDNVVKMMRAGTKENRQPLILMITNSGANRTGVCWNWHEYSAAVVSGATISERHFAYVCALDDDDDPFGDETCWAKANPSLGVTISPDYIRSLVTEARGMPSAAAGVMRLNFCRWTDAVNPWIDQDRWESAEREIALTELAALPCYLGLDLSRTKDLTSLAACWRHPDGRLSTTSQFWLPGDSIGAAARADRVPYELWRDQGYVNALPGRIIPYDAVALAVQKLTTTYQVEALAFDQAMMSLFVESCERVGFAVWIDDRKRDDQGIPIGAAGHGLRLVRHGQGTAGYNSETSLWMPRSVGELEKAIISETIAINKNPCLRWNSASAVLVPDPSGNRKWDKQKSNGRIDGIVALTMAVGLASTAPVLSTLSIWDRPELWL